MPNRSNTLRHATALSVRRPNRYWLIGALIVAMLYYSWGQVAQRRGNQVAAFRPAKQSCGNDGPLHYCIYRDQRGTNGDVLYHLHGRNLDERRWAATQSYAAISDGRVDGRPKRPDRGPVVSVALR